MKKEIRHNAHGGSKDSSFDTFFKSVCIQYRFEEILFNGKDEDVGFRILLRNKNEA